MFPSYRESLLNKITGFIRSGCGQDICKIKKNRNFLFRRPAARITNVSKFLLKSSNITADL